MIKRHLSRRQKGTCLRYLAFLISQRDNFYTVMAWSMSYQSRAVGNEDDEYSTVFVLLFLLSERQCSWKKRKLKIKITKRTIYNIKGKNHNYYLQLRTVRPIKITYCAHFSHGRASLRVEQVFRYPVQF